MEIIKHGNTKDKEPYRLTCYNCGCEFIADWSDTYTIATPIAFVAQGHNLGKWRYCDCPECKSMNMIEVLDMQGNPIKAEDFCKETAPDRSDCMYYDEGYGCETSPMNRCDICHDYTPKIKVDNNGFIGCYSMAECPAIPDDVLEKNKITPRELMEAYNDIERRRYEDNLPWWKKLFRKLFLFAFVALTAVQ